MVVESNVTFSSSAFLQYLLTSVGFMTVYWTVPLTRLIKETSIFSALESVKRGVQRKEDLLESLRVKSLEEDAHGEVDCLFQVHAFVVVLFEHAGGGLAASADAGCFPATVVA